MSKQRETADEARVRLWDEIEKVQSEPYVGEWMTETSLTWEEIAAIFETSSVKHREAATACAKIARYCRKRQAEDTKL